jgi:DNA polymerase-3 subunit epsilon
MRQIILDTETTGLEPALGHRIIEIGCIELINRKATGSRFHVYLNPEREVDVGAVDVHGLSNEFLADKPLFADVIQDFLDFIQGSELVIHNAPFDVGFLNHELKRLGADYRSLSDYCGILDTLALARKKHPGQRNSLDALCKRYAIDNSHRSLHGALLDAEILADVYLAMTGGQTRLMLEDEPGMAANADEYATPALALMDGDRKRLRVVACGPQELAAHEKRLDEIGKASGGKCLWTVVASQPEPVA